MLEGLESFVEVALAGNFGRAAKRLNVATSSLSRRVQALEAELGCMLLQRTPYGKALTEQGREALIRAERLLAEAKRLKEDLAPTSREVSGYLRVGAPVDLSIYLVGPLLAEFCRTHPLLTLELVATQGQPELVGDRLDCAFVIVHQRPLSDSGSVLHRISAFPRLPLQSIYRVVHRSPYRRKCRPLPSSDTSETSRRNSGFCGVVRNEAGSL